MNVILVQSGARIRYIKWNIDGSFCENQLPIKQRVTPPHRVIHVHKQVLQREMACNVQRSIHLSLHRSLVT